MSYRTRDGDYTAVSDVDLTVARGRFVSVVGPTGCGKSTLLNAVGLQLRGVAKRDRLVLARDWIKRVGLAGFEGAYPHQLSGGMGRRTALTQIWIGDPEMLLMDEPFGALDVQTRQLMENVMNRYARGIVGAR